MPSNTDTLTSSEFFLRLEAIYPRFAEKISTRRIPDSQDILAEFTGLAINDSDIIGESLFKVAARLEEMKAAGIPDQGQ